MNRLFETLGRTVDRRWKARNYDEALFPELAAATLAELDATLDPERLLAEVPLADALPVQPAPRSAFGEPPLTVYHSPRFYIDLLYWFDGTTLIHSHSFSGAFQVVRGSSIHSRYRFTAAQRVNSRLAVGDLAFESIERLQRGDIRPIVAGDRFIHALFHLDCPSVTLVVRTPVERDHQPQLNYLKPGLAIDSSAGDIVLRRKLECLSALERMNPERHDAVVRELLATADFATGLSVLQQYGGRMPMAELIDRLRARHGELCTPLPAAFEELARQRTIIQLRRQVTDADGRFLLACLLNAPDRQSLLNLLPVDALASGLGTLLSLEPDEVHVLRRLVQTGSDEAVLGQLRREYDSLDAGEVVAFCARVRSSPLCRPLFG